MLQVDTIYSPSLKSNLPSITRGSDTLTSCITLINGSGMPFANTITRTLLGDKFSKDFFTSSNNSSTDSDKIETTSCPKGFVGAIKPDFGHCELGKLSF